MEHNLEVFDDDDEHRTPPNMIAAANEVNVQLLPPKSKERYERTFRDFNKWKEENGGTSLSERTLLAYFLHLAEQLKPTSLWAYYSMLGSMLRLEHNTDISNYDKLLSFLKRKSEGYVPVKASVFTEAEMRDFIFQAPDDRWLAVKVVCIFGLCGALRTEEFVGVRLCDVKRYEDLIHVIIPDTKTKVSRSFTISEPFLQIVEKYMALRPPKTEKILTNRFFLRYADGKCTNNVIGKNKFSMMPREIAGFLNLEEPQRYTGHAFRRTSATILANSGAQMERLKRHGAWKSTAVAEGYVADSLAYKRDTGDMIVKSIDSGVLKSHVRTTEETVSTKSQVVVVSTGSTNDHSFDLKCAVMDADKDNAGFVSGEGPIAKKPRNQQSVQAIEVCPQSNDSFAGFSFHNCAITFNYYQAPPPGK